MATTTIASMAIAAIDAVTRCVRMDTTVALFIGVDCSMVVADLRPGIRPLTASTSRPTDTNDRNGTNLKKTLRSRYRVFLTL